MKRLVLEVKRADEGERLDRFIAERGGVARGEARRVLERGGVWIDRQRVKVASRPVREGQTVTVVLEEAGRASPSAFELTAEQILHDDASVLGVDKPSGVPAQATLGSDEGNLLSAASKWAGRQLGIVHRLDLETSGVTVFGRTRAATSALAAAFREGTARKVYLAVVAGALPEAGTVDLPIRGDPARKGSYLAGNEGAPSVTHYRVLARKGPLALVECRPETGRTHQIRVHMKALGAPLLGDKRYGGISEPVVLGCEGAPRAGRVMLHARSLTVPHPDSSEPLTIQAPIPEDMRPFLDWLGVDPSSL